MIETPIIIAPFVIGLITGLIGWRTVHNRATSAFFLVLGLLLAVSGGLFLAAEQAAGWDGIGYYLVMIFGSLPAAAAQLVGGVVGLVTRPQLPLPS